MSNLYPHNLCDDPSLITIYDFTWDDGQCDLGVWVEHPEAPDGICVEYAILTYDDDEAAAIAYDEDSDESDLWDLDLWHMSGEYRLPEGDLPPLTGVWISGESEPRFGREAREAWARMKRLCTEGTQVAANPEQEAMLAPRAGTQ